MKTLKVLDMKEIVRDSLKVLDKGGKNENDKKREDGEAGNTGGSK